MPRIQPIRSESADQKTAELLNGVEKKLGMIPNLVSTMAHSRAVANAYLGFSQALAAGSLPARLREQIAITVGQANECGYCVAAHCAIGQKAGLSTTEVVQARRGTAGDGQAQAALVFARKLVDRRGRVTDADLDRVRSAGFDDGAINEIVANVALNLFTNYFNHVAETDLDFPTPPEA